MRIGFDFDGVLTDKRILEICDSLGYEDQHEIYIITYRFHDVDYPDMQWIIQSDNIYKLGNTPITKEEIIKQLDLHIFFEDDDCCIQQIRSECPNVVILKPIYD